MKFPVRYLLLCMLLLLPLGLSARNTLTKKYVNRPVREVLSDLRKETGTSVRTQKKEVSTKRKVTVSFRNATPEQVLDALFDCEYVILPGKRQGSFIVNKRVMEQQIEVVATFYRDTMEIARTPIKQVEVDSLQAILVTYNSMKVIHVEDSLLLTREHIVRFARPQYEAEVHSRSTKKQKPAPVEVECLIMIDTTLSSATRVDTFFVQTVDTVASLDHILQGSIIWFAVNDYAHPRLHPTDVLDRVADVLVRYPKMRVRISGHASAEGNARINQVLSERRARTVANMLVEKGVHPDQLEVTALSSSVEFHSTDMDALKAVTGRSQAELNRRVEIRLIIPNL